jgi:hypothetical protein
MRTTISLDDRLAEQTRRRAQELGMSVSAFIAKTLSDALRCPPVVPKKEFRLITVKGSGVAEGVDLDRPRSVETGNDVEQFRT